LRKRKIKKESQTSSTNNKKRISKNTAYKRGRNFEYRVKKHFERNGYYVVRKYASKGAEDLIAIKSIELVTAGNSIGNGMICSEVLLIQCKNLKVEKKLKREDAERLIALAKQCGATPLLASNQNHKLNIIEVT
jgi:Holliday junction resolvase